MVIKATTTYEFTEKEKESSTVFLATMDKLCVNQRCEDCCLHKDEDSGYEGCCYQELVRKLQNGGFLAESYEEAEPTFRYKLTLQDTTVEVNREG